MLRVQGDQISVWCHTYMSHNGWSNEYNWKGYKTPFRRSVTYTHCGQRNIFYIALTTVRISRYSIPKSPKNHQIPLMQPLAACMFM